jgi:RNA polymerase sigma factor (sigma-70 family)
VDDISILLLTRWRGGDQKAATELCHRYTERLIGLARSRLPARMGVRVDAEDVIQSVYRSFFVAAREGRYVLQRSGDLWRLLVSLTIHKVQHQVRHHFAQKRTPGVEQNGSTEWAPNDEAQARDPQPEEAAALTDLLEQVLGRFEARDRRMIEMRLQGYRLGEIAADVGRCLHTVLRVIQRFRQELERTTGEHSVA